MIARYSTPTVLTAGADVETTVVESEAEDTSVTGRVGLSPITAGFEGTPSTLGAGDEDAPALCRTGTAAGVDGKRVGCINSPVEGARLGAGLRACNAAAADNSVLGADEGTVLGGLYTSRVGRSVGTPLGTRVGAKLGTCEGPRDGANVG